MRRHHGEQCTDAATRPEPCWIPLYGSGRSSTVRGRPTGQRLHARARLLDGTEAGEAAARLRRKYRMTYGVLVPLELWIKRARALYYELSEVRPAAQPGVDPGRSRPR